MFVRFLLLFVSAASAWAQSAHDARLQSYVHEALERNPRIHASLARYRAAQQKAPQVAGLPDPSVSLTNYVRSPETRVGPQTLMLQVQQRLPWFGKLSDRETQYRECVYNHWNVTQEKQPCIHKDGTCFTVLTSWVVRAAAARTLALPAPPPAPSPLYHPSTDNPPPS